jgi:hypothetical protein
VAVATIAAADYFPYRSTSPLRSGITRGAFGTVKEVKREAPM